MENLLVFLALAAGSNPAQDSKSGDVDDYDHCESADRDEDSSFRIGRNRVGLIPPKSRPQGATDSLVLRERPLFIFDVSSRTRTRSPEESRDLRERKSAALQWLALHQNSEGSWSSGGFQRRCSGDKCSGLGDVDYDVGVTGLAVLVFLGSDIAPYSRELRPIPGRPGATFRPGEILKKALQWLISQQDPEGAVGSRGPKYMYGHALATIALSEAYGMTTIAALKDPAQRAVDFLVAAQNPAKGWRYSFQSLDNDTSVTGWAIQALRSTEYSGLSFPRSAYEGALQWITLATGNERRRYQVSYLGYDRSSQFPGIYDLYDEHPTMTAVGLQTRLSLLKKKTDPAFAGVQLLTEDLPEAKQDKIDYNYWFLGSLALFQYDGPNGPLWTQWDEALGKALIPLQKRKPGDCGDGSWDPASKWGLDGGRVWATAINALTLCLREDRGRFIPPRAGWHR